MLMHNQKMKDLPLIPATTLSSLCPVSRSSQSKRLPPTRINIRLQFPTNERLDAMAKPYLTHQLVVALLVEEELVMPSERRIRLAMAVEVRCVGEAAAHGLVQEKHHALADVDEDADAAAALLHVLPAATALTVLWTLHTASRLRAEDGGAEQAHGGVSDLFACRGTPAFDGFFCQGVVVLGQADELVDCRMR